jgi:hypothetical protein
LVEWSLVQHDETILRTKCFVIQGIIVLDQ